MQDACIGELSSAVGVTALTVMAGLAPPIHVLDAGSKDVDARHKAGHDGAGQRASMTARYFAWILPPIRYGGRGDEQGPASRECTRFGIGELSSAVVVTAAAVMAGLVPAIHVLDAGSKDVDARHKAGHDGAGQRASMTARYFALVLPPIRHGTGRRARASLA